MIRLTLLVCALLLPMLGACSPYQLQGRVVKGPASFIQVVDADDPRLSDEGLGGARVSVMMDPESLGRRDLGSGLSGVDGDFAIPIDEVGAGLFEYEIGVQARMSGRHAAVTFIRMPPSGKRLLIMLAPGKDAPDMDDPFEGEDLYGEYERYR